MPFNKNSLMNTMPGMQKAGRFSKVTESARDEFGRAGNPNCQFVKPNGKQCNVPAKKKHRQGWRCSKHKND